MKKTLLFISILTFLACAAFSQQPPVNKERGGRIEALKIAYLTKRLTLTTEEAQRFWPVYNEYTAEIRAIHIEQKENKSSELDMEEKILKVRKKYSTEFAKALTPEKANLFFRSEKDFAGYVQRELNERRGMKQNRQQPK